MAIPWRSILPNGGCAFIGVGACVPFAVIAGLLATVEPFHDVELVHILVVLFISPTLAKCNLGLQFLLSPQNLSYKSL